MSDEMWVMSEKLHDILIQCLETEDSVLRFINWFFDGIRKAFGSKTNINDNNLSLPEICFQCERPYTNGCWCNSCESYLFEANFKNWNTGNVELNKFIRQSQLNSLNDKNFLKWIPFNDFKHLKEFGSGGFSTMYSARWSNDILDGTLQQWVTNMEVQIILDYIKSHDVHFTDDDWNAVLSEFMKKMRVIFETRKTLKCKPLSENDAESTRSSRISSRINSRVNSLKLKRKDSFAKIKGLFKSLKKNRSNSSIRTTPSSDSVYATSRKMIKNVPVTTSPLKKRLYQNVALKRLHNSTSISSKFINEFKPYQLSLTKNSSSKYLISDYGLHFPSDSTDKSLGTKLYGVLPFMAPEVLRGGPYTKAADIYSLDNLGPFAEAEKFRLRNSSRSTTHSDLDPSFNFPSSRLLVFNNLPEPKNSKNSNFVTLKSGNSDISLNSVKGLKVSELSENKPQGNHQINLSIDSAVGISPMK
ncbi:1353_t:CDS:2 [Dentiscutata erythropus]|uniref:1353_t:CDS:1 n=1 Tax=Dentiscutata erythropus TaxID=1348616 RepID=A0A9N9D6B7_9GLOM|nr:1353_t:CDS:2 [Dentiscutata erythropus]